MISFSIPAGTYDGRAVSLTTAKFDRGFNENTEVRLHRSSIADWPRQEQTANGINTRNVTLTGTINVRTESDHLDIIAYIKSLKSASAVTITYPDASTKTVIINSWNVSYPNYLYSNVQLTMEVIY